MLVHSNRPKGWYTVTSWRCRVRFRPTTQVGVEEWYAVTGRGQLYTDAQQIELCIEHYLSNMRQASRLHSKLLMSRVLPQRLFGSWKVWSMVFHKPFLGWQLTNALNSTINHFIHAPPTATEKWFVEGPGRYFFLFEEPPRLPGTNQRSRLRNGLWNTIDQTFHEPKSLSS
ncbi:hypothetical protein BDR07DRAFT_1375414 [Suillus spraguei]|nr:hypothetical protein BDR07DRAFT_1375414 [Suillus spraguei]